VVLGTHVCNGGAWYTDVKGWCLLQHCIRVVLGTKMYKDGACYSDL
jgi:hypothetical protein